MTQPINILIVDDEPKNLTVLETVLDDPGYRLVRAASADEALLALVAEEFALLILDIRMPGMTGIELAQTIKERKKTAHIPIIFLTAYYNDDLHVLAGYGTGAVDYLHKPVNAPILCSKVAVFAELHRMQREATEANRALLAEVAARKRLEAEVLDITQQERTRFAEDLHDGICQELIAAQFLASALRKALEKAHPPQAAQARRIEEVIGIAEAHTRQAARGMAPVIADGHGLMHALPQLAGTTAETHRVQCVFECPEEVLLDCPKAANELYRIAQEAVLNALRHGKANRITIRLTATATELTLSVADNGSGLPPDAANSDGMGLRVMRHRAERIGGRFNIQSRARSGTLVECRIAKG